MAIGPVQLIVLGFSEPNFQGEVLAELDRLKENDVVRVIDAIVVYKDADGEGEPAQATIGRLEELRVVALEQRVEADLAEGRHADLVGELATLVAQPCRPRTR